MDRSAALRQSTTSSRTLTLTEELEQLEQSITLTLQGDYLSTISASETTGRSAYRVLEIDHNFSRAHRIVTSSILPIVEQYAEHSKNVWEGAKFWKQFFEASANVSLSGYEEADLEDDLTHETTATTLTDATYEASSPADQTSTGAGDSASHSLEDEEDDASVIDSPTHTAVHSTPRMPATAEKNGKGRAALSRPKPVHSPSPEKRTISTNGRLQPPNGSPSFDPSTPGKAPKPADSSPFNPPSAYQPPTAERRNNDPLLHRVLDKNYRIQATPHNQRSHRLPHPRDSAPVTHATTATATRTALWADDSLDSSPEVSAPQLRSDIFSPEKRKEKALRTPGVSVLTPGKRNAPTTSTGRGVFSSIKPNKAVSLQNPTLTRASDLWGDSDSDEDTADMGVSPPKTMQFHVPQSRLLQTPAREASRRIVEDLLMTAGADATGEIEGDGEDESPILVRRKADWDDDTF
ncbi:DASH complex subunit ask1 [Elasticomyces elasticus]|nr:DASH complex subunit ask1 [Elasticomyces elasticus]